MLNYRALNNVLRALADPTRRAIVEQLCDRDASVSELAEPLAISLPGVMQHLRVLEKCGLIRMEKTGRVRTCHLEPQGLRLLEQWIARRYPGAPQRRPRRL
jgi:DNA-binding transcriptional ArsR family regulator